VIYRGQFILKGVSRFPICQMYPPMAIHAVDTFYSKRNSNNTSLQITLLFLRFQGHVLFSGFTVVSFILERFFILSSCLSLCVLFCFQDGRVDRIHDAVGSVVNNSDKMEEVSNND
jgi:hypothetical protein